MQFIEKEIEEYSKNIWKSTLSLDTKPAPEGTSTSEKGFALTGCVHITGAWSGCVTVDFPMSLAEKVASIMFNLNGQKVNEELIQDALGELTNMTGGNIKSLLPEPCHLSLPAVALTESQMRIPGGELLTQVTLECEKELFQVSLIKKLDTES